MPVERHTANNAVPTHAATTSPEPSHHGIDRHRSITTPITIPTPNAAYFHGNPGEGAGYVTSGETQNRNTGDKVVPGGALQPRDHQGEQRAAHHHDDRLPDAPSVPSGSLDGSPQTAEQHDRADDQQEDPDGHERSTGHGEPTPHGPEDVISPATQLTSSHADTRNNAPHATMQHATVR